jgi:hypothetical protein
VGPEPGEKRLGRGTEGKPTNQINRPAGMKNRDILSLLVVPVILVKRWLATDRLHEPTTAADEVATLACSGQMSLRSPGRY